VILRVEVPEPPTPAARLRIERWCVGVGERFAFGDVLARIAVDARSVLNRPKDAGRIIANAADPTASHERAVREKRGTEHLELVASEAGWLRAQVSFEGGLFAPGDTIAYASTEADEPIDDALTAAALPLRIVVELLDIDEDFA
jgi:hypothetical protein